VKPSVFGKASGPLCGWKTQNWAVPRAW
jgi:hypothetical protein